MDLREQLQRHLGTAYTLERELGGGGMSRVFVANEVRLGRKVVVKVLSPELAQGLNVERFEREIRLAASLQHANIVPLLVAGDVDGIPWFTMPFVEGESVRHRLADGTVPITEVVSILRDVTRALAYAHAHGVVHRDIKPDNVLLAGGAATVTDFGIAKAISASRTDAPGATLTQLGTSLGTPAYMAPEQVAGDPDLDHRVDLYALGCTAFELLTGQQPYADRTPQRMLAAHLSEAVPSVAALRPDTPPPLESLITRLMAKDPNDRPQSAMAVLQSLDGVSTTSATTLTFSAPGMFRKALLIYAVATAVVLLCARAAVIAIGLPDWVFPGAIVVMGLGLPALLITAYVQHVNRRVSTATPTLTPGGTAAARMPSGTIATMAVKASPHLTWRRTWRGGAMAVVGFVVLVTVFMVSRAEGIGPWGSLIAAGKLGSNNRIVIANLVASPNDSALAPIVVEAVRAGLAQSNAIHLVDAGAIADVLQQMKRSRDTPLDSTAVVHEVAVRSNADGILGGRLTQVGSSYVVSLSLTATNDGAVLASFQNSANGVKDLLGVVDEITRKLRGRIGESLKRVQVSIPLQRATTSSLDALRLYSEGSTANDIDRNYEHAVDLLRQAVALDSTFAMGWRKLAVALANAGRYSQLTVDSAVEKATQYADKLPELEKNMIWAEYYYEDERGLDRGKALAAYQRAYALDSSNGTGATDLALIYAKRLQFDSAVRYRRRTLQVEPSTARAINLITDLTDLGRLDSAEALLDSLTRATRDGATNGRILQARARLFRAHGQWDSMAVIAATLNRLAAGHPDRPAGRSIAAMVAELEGRYSSVVDSVGPGGGTPLGRAYTDITFRQRPGDGIKSLDEFLASKEWSTMLPAEHLYPFVAMLYAQAGAAVKARAVLEESLKRDPGANAPDFQPDLAAVRGQIALAEGKFADAIRETRASGVGSDGAPTGSAATIDYQLAEAFDRSGHADSALAYLQRYLAVPNVLRPDQVYLAAVEKRLGELFDARKQRDSALAHFTAFVEHWKHADPDLQPTVASVRKRMAELVAQEGH